MRLRAQRGACNERRLGSRLVVQGAGPVPSSVSHGGRDLLHPPSNNIAEFFGFRASLRRALRLAPRRVVFELDSLLVVMMMSGKWGCHRQHLRVLLAECYDLGEQLSQAGCDWTIRHVYREYNRIADQLAETCLRDLRQAHESAAW